ncbi:testis-expressed protein 45 [Coturnix japonica]|uniref:testis-expressed protein 45 n=1 Tax=Coturnix japonica TaxID=93934 RepID=UPI0007774B8E|nr:testis-expressed protein 45 [Coturnix japonica]
MVTRPGRGLHAGMEASIPAQAPIPAQIPAPLTGIPFLKASHLQLGADRVVPQDSRPFSHVQFPPIWGDHKPMPAELPRSGDVLNQSLAVGGAQCSETRLAFPEKPLQRLEPLPPPAPGIRMHADPRISVCSTTMRDSFPCHAASPTQPAIPKAQETRDRVICGDREKIRLPPSVHTTSYPAHDVHPAARAHPSYKGCDPIIKEDGQPSYHTSHQMQFKGEHSPPAKLSEKHKSRIIFGDPRSSGSVSEQKYAYTAPAKREHRFYDKERAVFQIHHTNVQQGDGRTRFSTTVSEHFPVHNAEPVDIVRRNKNTSSILKSEEDLERITTTRSSYPETGRWNFSPKPDLQKHRSNVCLGDDRSGSSFFSTTQHSDYQTPHQPQRVTGYSKKLRESHLPFDYYNENPISITKATLVPHRQLKQRLFEDIRQQMKRSHLVMPWKEQNFFSTEQKDEFTPKDRDIAEIQATKSYESSIPLGTLKKYGSQRKVVFSQ